MKLLLSLSRDFLPGENICDEVVLHMSRSRCNIIVLSSTSINKPWPMYELQRAQNDMITMNKKFIVIKLGKIDSANASGLAKDILDSGAYMQWPKEKSAGKKSFQTIQKRQQLFWAKLASKIYHQGQCSCFNYHSASNQREGLQVDESIDDVTQLVD